MLPLADSLGLPADTLRALAIRYRFAPERLVTLADSLGVPVDSVGVVLERERFNPLVSRAAHTNVFTYNTTYNVQQTRSSWGNTSDYNLTLGPLFLRNTASIQMDRFASGRRTSIRQTRSSTTETGWKITPDYSVGGRAILGRFDSDDPGTISGVGEDRNEYQLSIRTRQRPMHALSSEINLFSGVLDLSNTGQEKGGATADLNGRAKFALGSWLDSELSSQISGNLARTRLPTSGERLNTRDVSRNADGTLNLFASSPIGLNATYRLLDSHVEVPDTGRVVRPVETSNSDLSATLRMRLDSGRSLNLTQSFGASDQVIALSNSQSSRASRALVVEGRYAFREWALDGRFLTDLTESEVPRVTPDGGYGEDLRNRSLNGTLVRQIARRLNARASARIALTSYRYRIIGTYGTPPVSRDQVQQSYRIEGNYTVSSELNSGLALDVSRTQLVNIPSASTASNNALRTYRAEWRWTYRLLRGFTATQFNTLGANYTAYVFAPQSDRLGLDYSTTTTLSAVLTPRFSTSLVHSAQFQPSGNYTRSLDGLYYFNPADESRTSALSSAISYTPWPGLALEVQPSFRSSARDGTLNGQTVPQRQNRTLAFLGSARLNLRVGQKGSLTGTIGRSYQADRTTSFASGVPQPSPLSEFDYWNGALQLSWQL